MQPVPQQSPKPADLAEIYSSVRKHTELLCEPLEIEDYVPQPIPDVSPVRWNIAHTTWFFEEMILKSHLQSYKEFDPEFGYLFNSYYNTIGRRTLRHKRGDLSRPTVKAIFDYRKHVDEHMYCLFESDLPSRASELTILGINHEQQHQELLITDLKYTLSVNPLNPVYREGFQLVEDGSRQSAAMMDISGGSYDIGFEGSGFCFDNELTRHRVRLNDFQISAGLVTNEDFLEFMDDGGYEDFRLWHSDGWDWVTDSNIQSPLYWNMIEGEWHQYTLGGLRKIIPGHSVCHISFFEASAFAAWKGSRLPTEYEWEASSPQFDWGLRWEWTNSAYLPYPGFKVAPGAVGEYNGKFMINQMVLRGASSATPEGHSRSSYRNFFHPHSRWQFTGLRLAK